ncbi:hypothetical protein EVAR_21107_1 [Eumeta japonica]|uniref:Uncharacterized protein n=1 Tax=Eumeta variegata TaxID=151549 RepID=A0A4C1VTS3_EUMVA|nr:hypothetical protein EVAR_21107_1 [Eumeta japonica]
MGVGGGHRNSHSSDERPQQKLRSESETLARHKKAGDGVTTLGGPVGHPACVVRRIRARCHACRRPKLASRRRVTDLRNSIFIAGA